MSQLRSDSLFAAAVTVVATLLLGAAAASAHDVGLSQGSYAVRGETLEVELTFARADLAGFAGASAERAAAQALGVRSETVACAVAEASFRLEEKDGRSLVARFDCPAAPTEVEASFLELLPRGHRHVAQLGEHTRVLHGAPATLDVSSVASTPAASAYLVLGVEHILIGADHLAFLLALVLVGMRRRDALAIVTSFTAGHSITLALAALGLFTLPGSIVEPLIAASIAWVGVENLTRPSVSARWRLALLFGLIHGLGFAGVLSEIGLPASDELLALVLFNGGVELGQLLVLVLTLPALAFAHRRRWFRDVGAPAVSAALIGLGLFWFIERVL
jgi:hydrogenase/urease accessory protein HupE